MSKRNLMQGAALCALAIGGFSTAAHAQDAGSEGGAQAEDRAQGFNEIIVTARKRSENLQDVALSVQAFGEKQLAEQNIQSFEDYVKFLPSVAAGGRGPGQNEIYIRGAAVDAINITVAESQGSAPNVALYLDEQPVTAGGRNLDVYVSDMERIEVLPGPQGTLYGASSMAGTVRLITNKPVIDEFSGKISGSYSLTKGGEDSQSLEAAINIPVIENKMAVRIAAYHDSQGGYIDNIEGTFRAQSSINPTFPGDTVDIPAGTVFANGDVHPGGPVPVNFTVANNAALVEDDFNDATYNGIRIGAKYEFSPDWSLLVQHARQALRTEGVWDYDPTKGDLNVSRFAEDELEDDFNQTAWTVEGRLGALNLLYTGAYLDRDVEANIDYTGYTNIGAFISGYQCEYLVGSFYTGPLPATNRYVFDPTLGGDPGVIECGSPVNASRISNENTRWTHEFRVSSDLDGMINFTAGLFYEDFKIKHVGEFNYQAPIDAGFAPIDINLNPTFDNSVANARDLVTAATEFRNDNTRTEEQFAVFGEVSLDITDELNVTLGARHYDLEYGYTGYGAWRYGNRPLFVDDGDPTNDIRPNVTGGREYEFNFAELQPIKISDQIFKATVSYQPTSDLLFYLTWSEGYRPPGFNRAAAREGGLFDASANNIRDDGTECGIDVAIDSNPATGFPGYCLPYVFESDTLENYELGWKTTFANGAVRFNGAIYRIDWKDIQVSQFDSQNISILTIVDNGGDAEITGVEVDLAWSVTENLSIFAAASYNDTELTFVDPAFDIVVADAGSPLPLTPKFQGNARARYEWPVSNDLEAFIQVAGKYAGSSVNSLVDTATEPQQRQDPYFIMDMAAGIDNVGEGWGLELFVSNLTDERAQLHINRQDFIERITTNRPRTIGARINYSF